MKEFDLHKACAQFLDVALPEDAVWFHPASGEKRPKATAGKLRAMGVKPGIPDLCIIYQGQAVFVELKAGKGRLSDAQEFMQWRLVVAGARVMIECRSVEALAAFLEQIIPLRAKVA